MRKTTLMVSMVLLALAAFAPTAFAQTADDASCEPGVDCQDVLTGDGTEGFDFFEGFEVPTQEEILGDDFLDGGFFADSDFGSLLGEDFFFGSDFFDEGKGNEEGPAGGSESDCIEDPNNPGQPAPDCEDVG